MTVQGQVFSYNIDFLLVKIYFLPIDYTNSLGRNIYRKSK